MKLQLLLFTLTYSTILFPQNINDQTLPEVIVTNKTKIEKNDKTVLIPTKLEKKHAVNAIDLLNVIEIPEIEVSLDTKRISTKTGGEVIVCINGMEVQQEEMTTLLSKNIQKIEYIRTPSGKYAGKAGMINIITKQADFGGNIYLSAKESFFYNNGDYTAFADFTKKKLTFSLTASGDWLRNTSYTEGTEKFIFSNGKYLSRETVNNNSLYKENNQALRFKITSIGDKYKFNSYIALTRKEQPQTVISEKTIYSGLYENQAERNIYSTGKDLSPSFYANYSINLPHNQNLDITGSAFWGNNEYSSKYTETDQSTITSMVNEDNYGIKGNIMYAKSFNNKMKLSVTGLHNHITYKDTYNGSATGNQKLSTNISQGVLQISQSGRSFFYYLSGGISNSFVVLNGNKYNYCNPVAFYGGNYAINKAHSLSLNGYYVHTLFDPSNKNSMTIPISFFESVKGNPDISPLKAFGNIISYNGQFGCFLFNVSYNGYMYFDNIVHFFYTDNNTIYNTRINDGTFYGNMFTATLSYSTLENRLRLSATAIEEYNMMRGQLYNLSKNIFRTQFSATYLLGDWMMKFNYRTPYKVIDIREPYYMTRKPVYELLIGWNHKAWNIEAMIRNPFSKYDKNHITMDYGCYNKNIWDFSEANGNNLSLKLTYSFSYGKKSQRGDVTIDKSTKNAILKNN